MVAWWLYDTPYHVGGGVNITDEGIIHIDEHTTVLIHIVYIYVYVVYIYIYTKNMCTFTYRQYAYIHICAKGFDMSHVYTVIVQHIIVSYYTVHCLRNH